MNIKKYVKPVPPEVREKLEDLLKKRSDEVIAIKNAVPIVNEISNSTSNECTSNRIKKYEESFSEEIKSSDFYNEPFSGEVEEIKSSDFYNIVDTDLYDTGPQLINIGIVYKNIPNDVYNDSYSNRYVYVRDRSYLEDMRMKEYVHMATILQFFINDSVKYAVLKLPNNYRSIGTHVPGDIYPYIEIGKDRDNKCTIDSRDFYITDDKSEAELTSICIYKMWKNHDKSLYGISDDILRKKRYEMYLSNNY